MTLLMAWVGVDQRDISSLYIGADSRYTWNGGRRNDSGIKVYGSSTQPHIFGFCGNVTLMQNIISQLNTHIDLGMISSENKCPKSIVSETVKVIKSVLRGFPNEETKGSSIIYHGFRLGRQNFNFVRYKIVEKAVSVEIFVLPDVSSVIASDGTGKDDFEKVKSRYLKSDNNYGTSRMMYHLLSEAIDKSKRDDVGGVPQIVGLYRKGNAKIFGIVKGELRYLNGLCVDDNIKNLDNIEWRNECFERIDPQTLGLLPGAQRQPFS